MILAIAKSTPNVTRGSILATNRISLSRWMRERERETRDRANLETMLARVTRYVGVWTRERSFLVTSRETIAPVHSSAFLRTTVPICFSLSRSTRF